MEFVPNISSFRSYSLCTNPKVVVGFHQHHWTYTFSYTWSLKSKVFVALIFSLVTIDHDTRRQSLALHIIPISSPRGNVSVVRSLTWKQAPRPPVSNNWCSPWDISESWENGGREPRLPPAFLLHAVPDCENPSASGIAWKRPGGSWPLQRRPCGDLATNQDEHRKHLHF